jgi:CubicO group peptidase (beta-lactamase class C family)
MTIKRLLTTTLLLVTGWLSAQVPEPFGPRWDSLVTAYHAQLDRVNIVGSSIFFIRNGEIVAKALHGYQDQDTREPITLRTIYNWGSCTKPFTAIAVMQLRDAGRLNLEDPVARYVPEVSRFRNKFNQPITLLHLLEHTSGLPRFSATARLKEGVFYEADNWEAFRDGFAAVELAFEPGSRYSYSNLGYNLLGRLIENVTHVPFAEYVTAHILAPLGMHSSYFDVTPGPLAPDRSNNYLGHKQRLYPAGKDFTGGLGNASGGLNAPVPDMIRFMNFLYLLDEEQDVYGKVLKRSTLEEMFKPRQLMHGKGKRAAHTHYVGMGFHTVNPESFPVIGHEGQLNGFLSSIWVNVATKTGYALAWNTSHRLPVKKDDALFRDLNEAMYNRLFPLFGTPGREATPPTNGN